MLYQLLRSKFEYLTVVDMLEEWADKNVILIYALVALMAIDYIAGMIAAKMRGSWEVRAAFDGLCRKFGTLLILAAAAVIDVVLPYIKEYLLPDAIEISSISGVVISCLCIGEFRSIIKNYKKMGRKPPSVLTKLFFNEPEKNDSNRSHDKTEKAKDEQ